MQDRAESKRYVRLTEQGCRRVAAARRKFGKTIEEIVADRNTPSINTVKRALAGGAVFVDTLDRIWDYLRGCAAGHTDSLPDLEAGDDYEYISGDQPEEEPTPARAVPKPGGRKGWLSRQVPQPNRLFTGRQDVLARLHVALKRGPTAIVADPQALVGLGGIGKTQTAIAYAHAHRLEYNSVFWVRAETSASLNDGLA